VFGALCGGGGGCVGVCVCGVWECAGVCVGVCGGARVCVGGGRMGELSAWFAYGSNF